MFTPYSDPYHAVRQRPGTNIIQVTRSSVAFSARADVDRHFEALRRSFDALDRPRHELLIDLRAAVGRNDSEFEAAVAPHRAHLQRGFRRVAVLITSIAGQLQIKRFAVQDGVPVRSFYDEDEAVKWLAQR